MDYWIFTKPVSCPATRARVAVFSQAFRLTILAPGRKEQG